MSDDKKSENSTGAEGTKRPHATLDLKAERVAEEEPEGASRTSEAEAASADEPAREATPRDDAGPPPPPREGGGARFLTHLAAGLLGGLIALVIGYYALGNFRDRLPFVSEISAEQIRSDQDALEQRIAELAGRSSEARAQLADRVSALDARTEGLARTDNEALQSLAERVETLEQQLQTATDTSDETARAERIASVGERVSGLEESVAALRASLEEMRAQSAENVASTRASTLAIALSNLRRAVDRGESYSAELAAVRELSTETVETDALGAAAETGVPTLAGLRRSFPRYANAALDAAGASDDDSIIGQIVESARSVVNVRPVGEIEGDSPGAVIARIENRLKAGDLPGVLAQGEQLTGPAAAELAPWIEQVGTRIKADNELDALEAEILAASTQ